MHTNEPPINAYEPPADVAEPPVDAAVLPTVATQPRPWGFWATLGFSLLVYFVFFVVQTVVAIAYVVFTMVTAPDPGSVDLEALGQDGDLMVTAQIPAAFASVAFILLFCWIRRGMTLRSYLRWNWPAVGKFILWVVVLLLLIAGIDLLSLSIGRPIVPEFVENLYHTAYLGTLLIALLVAAPVFEEVFFRGFMLEGFRLSKLGTVGAVLLTSLLWAVIHFQYDWYGIASIFVMGIVLAAARLHTDSLITTIILHTLANVVATVEVAVL